MNQTEILVRVASEHRDIDRVKADFIRLRTQTFKTGIEEAAAALLLNPVAGQSPLDINTIVAAYLVGITWDIATLRKAWIAALDFMGDQDLDGGDDLELVDSPL